MYKVAAVGAFDELAHFKALGAELFSPKTQESASDIKNKIIAGEYAVVFVTREYAGAFSDGKKELLPVIVILPY